MRAWAVWAALCACALASRELRVLQPDARAAFYVGIAAPPSAAAIVRAFNKSLAEISQTYLAGDYPLHLRNITLLPLYIELPEDERMRTYKRKTDRGKTSESLLRQAANAVIKEERKIKTVARELEICHMTLHRFVKKNLAGKNPTVGYKSRSVFTTEQEKELASYILRCSSIYFGLLPGEVRKLAYECAVKFSLENMKIENGEPPQHSTTDQGDAPRTATSTINSGQELQLTPAKTNASAVFSPEIVKPLPKAPPRLQTATKRRIRKTAVLTHTPEKNALAEEQSKKKAKKNENILKKGKGKNNNNKGKGKGKGKGKEKAQEKAKRRVLQDSESDSDKDLESHCIICCDSYSNSLPREQWIECCMCKNWAHVKCINKGDTVTYVCPNCDSGEKMSDE